MKQLPFCLIISYFGKRTIDVIVVVLSRVEKLSLIIFCFGNTTTNVIAVLLSRVEKIPGAAVEHNKFCVSVHFRNCSPEAYEHVVTAVKDTLNDHPNLKASRGRKVLEIQPQVRAYAAMRPL